MRKWPVILALAISMAGCTIGPLVETRHVIVRPGHPMMVTQSVKVKGQFIGDDSESVQDVGGWIAMPKDHWDWLEAELRKARGKLAIYEEVADKVAEE